jgi:steroid 5-alpha reductase family enzyme
VLFTLLHYGVNGFLTCVLGIPVYAINMESVDDSKNVTTVFGGLIFFFGFMLNAVADF